MKEYFWILGSLCVVLFNTCHLFPQTAIDLCGFLVVDRRRTSVFWMCAASYMWKVFSDGYAWGYGFFF